jgi:hypothetical protein
VAVAILRISTMAKAMAKAKEVSTKYKAAFEWNLSGEFNSRWYKKQLKTLVMETEGVDLNNSMERARVYDRVDGTVPKATSFHFWTTKEGVKHRFTYTIRPQAYAGWVGSPILVRVSGPFKPEGAEPAQPEEPAQPPPKKQKKK